MLHPIEHVYRFAKVLTFPFRGKVSNNKYWCKIYAPENHLVARAYACAPGETEASDGKDHTYMLDGAILAEADISEENTNGNLFAMISAMSLKDLQDYLWKTINPLFPERERFFQKKKFEIIFTKQGIPEKFLYLSRVAIHKFFTETQSGSKVSIHLTKTHERKSFFMVDNTYISDKVYATLSIDTKNIIDFFKPHGYSLRENNYRCPDQIGGYTETYCIIDVTRNDFVNLSARENLILAKDYKKLKGLVTNDFSI